MNVPLDPRYLERLTFQAYPHPPQIGGVQIVRLRKHRSLEGDFMEYLRLADGRLQGIEADFEVRQVSIARAVPGRVNAFHVHPKRLQDEWWTVVQGTLLVWLADVRQDSPTVGVLRPCVLSDEEPVMLHIPAGVAHGYKAGLEGAMLVYAANDTFDASDPNEGRLPWDCFGAELWEADRG